MSWCATPYDEPLLHLRDRLKMRAEGKGEQPMTMAPCRHFGDCGGCSLQHLPYWQQLEQKQERIENTLSEAGFNEAIVERIRGMEHPYRYRNKMEFTFSPDGGLGLHRPGRFDSIIHLEECYLCSEEMETVLRGVQNWARALGLPGYNKHTHQGFLRHLIVRQSGRNGDLMIAIMTTDSRSYPEALADLKERLVNSGLPIASLLWGLNTDPGDKARSEEAVKVLHGRPFIHDEIAGFSYELFLDTFFQVNSVQAEILVEKLLEWYEVPKPPLTLDLFCGVGTLSLPLAQSTPTGQVVGIEVVPAAVRAARENAERNEMTNLAFHESDVRRGIPRVIEDWGKPGAIILDPPRSGAGGKVMRRIARTGMDRVLYVSCNPVTLVHDVAEMAPFGYGIARVTPIDMFPQTEHVESVCLIERK